MLDAFNRLFNNSTSRDFAMAMQVFNTSANEYACNGATIQSTKTAGILINVKHTSD